MLRFSNPNLTALGGRVNLAATLAGLGYTPGAAVDSVARAAAATAQTTANTAQTTANTAQTTANTANTAAYTAQTTADTTQGLLPIHAWTTGQALLTLTDNFEIVCQQTLATTLALKKVFVSATFNLMSKDASTTTIEFYLSRGDALTSTQSQATESSLAAGEYRTYSINWYDVDVPAGNTLYRLYARCVEAPSPTLKWDVRSCNIFTLGLP